MDNFAWTSGYTRRFGIVYVDDPTRRSIPKAGFDFYRQVFRANAVPEG